MTNPIRTLTNTIETKVIASTAGGGGGAVVATFLLWLLGVVVWHAPDDASKAVEAVAAVPSPVTALVGMAVVVLGGFIAGYLAPHTSRTPGAHSTDTATPASISPADLSSTPIGAEPVASTVLAGQPPSPSAGMPYPAAQDGLPALTADMLPQAAAPPPSAAEPAAG